MVPVKEYIISTAIPEDEEMEVTKQPSPVLERWLKFNDTLVEELYVILIPLSIQIHQSENLFINPSTNVFIRSRYKARKTVIHYVELRAIYHHV